jgi:predicted ATPase/GAF domain-containing protein/tRNA A-37 threonylcarbamoyl transferase component Bud32
VGKQNEFRLAQKLAESHVSVVYRGSAGARPAIFKQLKKEAFSQEQLARFDFEYDAVLSCRSEWVVAPIDRVEIAGIPTMVYEDIGGESVRSLLSSRRLSVEECLRVGVGVVRALEAIHAARIIHKDINPQNIIVNLQNGKVQVIDFGISTRLAREVQSIDQLGKMEGTLEYLSPEQTGRVNQALDRRTDYYSFGVTLYELLSGATPFSGKEPSELVHKILASEAPRLVDVSTKIPAVLGKIVHKLISKDPNARYQSAKGLLHDLEKCLSEYQAKKDVADFAIATRDQSDRFAIPDKLYGREADIDRLNEAFTNTSQGGNELVLVHGPSGIGKSALVDELKKAIFERKAIAVSGKFDQFKRHIPYAVVAMAFNQIAADLYTQERSEIERIQGELRSKLGDSRRLLSDIAPNLEQLVGDVPPLAGLEPDQARLRLAFVMRTFVDVVTATGRPVVLFFDDLQWADSGTFDVIEALAGEGGPSRLMTIGAYRDNEVNEFHPAMITIGKLKNQRSRTLDLTVAPLSKADTIRLVRDTTLSEQGAEILGSSIHTKTGGNPFFVRTFLNFLFDSSMLRFSGEKGCWIWDQNLIDQQSSSDNVVELLLKKLKGMADGTRSTLTLAACLGPRFDLKSLTALNGVSFKDVSDRLWPAIDAGLVIPLSQNYKFITKDMKEPEKIVYRFAHDRIHQASHELMSLDQTAKMHFDVAQLLLKSLGPKELRERIFEVVDHLNQGKVHASSSADREMLAKLNIEAGVQARNSGVFTSSIHYLNQAKEFVDASWWKRDPHLMAAVYEGLAHGYNALNQPKECDEALTALVTNAVDPIVRALAYEKRGAMLEAKAQFHECIEACLKGLAILGVKLPVKVGMPRLMLAMSSFNLLVNEKFLRWYENPKDTKDPKWVAITQLVSRAIPSCYVANQDLWAYMIMKTYTKAYREGVYIDEAAFGNALAIVIMSIRKMWLKTDSTAIRIKNVAHKLAQKKADSPVNIMYWMMAGHWTDVLDKTMEDCVAAEEQCYRIATHAGDIGNQGCSIVLMHINKLIGGYPLPSVVEGMETYVKFFQARADHWITPLYWAVLQTARCLNGQTRGPNDLSDERIEETELRRWTKASSSGNHSVFKLFRAMIDFSQRRYSMAVKESINNLVDLTLPACPTGIIHYCVLALAIVRSLRFKQKSYPRPMLLMALGFAKVSIRWWGKNYRYFAAGHAELVDAEISAWKGRHEKAAEQYNVALTKFVEAKKYYWVAFTNEALCEMYRDLNVPTKAQIYYKEALSAYRRFGSPVLLDQFVNHFADMSPDVEATLDRPRSYGAGSTRTSTSSSTTSALDIQSVIKASQAIAGQIDIHKLTQDILHIAMENAGADYGVLLSADGAQLTAKVLGQLKNGSVGTTMLESSADVGLCRGAVNVAFNSKKPLIVNDLSKQSEFAGDPHVKNFGAKSIICQPIVIQGAIAAVLYLENRQMVNAFTPSRIEILNILAAQGAVSLKNAGFVRDIQEKSKHINGLKGQLEKILAGTKSMAASKSMELAIGEAFKTMSDEISAFRDSNCAIVLKGRDSDGLTYWPLQRDGHFDRKNSLAGSVSEGAKWSRWIGIQGVQDLGAGTIGLGIRWQEEPVGLLIVSGLKNSGLNQEESRFMETLSQSLALSLRNLEYQYHLEDLVAQRTKALNEALREVTAKQRKIQAIMDHIDQGILTLDESQTIEPEFSARLAVILGLSPGEIASKNVTKLVFARSGMPADALNRIEEVLRAVIGEDEISWSLNESHLPRETSLEFSGERRILEIDWNVMVEDGTVKKMMLTLRDVTEARALKEKVKAAQAMQDRKMTALGELLSVDRIQLRDFLRDCKERIGAVRGVKGLSRAEFDLMFRNLHTIKGTASTLGIRLVATLTHETEDEVPTERNGKKGLDSVAFRAKLDKLDEQIDYLRSLSDEVFGGGSVQAGRWTLHNLSGQFIQRLDQVAAQDKLTFGGFEVVDEVGVWPEELRRSVAAMVPHCVNNALDHGYALPAKRGERVRPLAIKLAGKVVGDQIRIEVADTGVGLDHTKIKALAERRGISGADYMEVLFQDGASTAEQVTMTSGRGVGLGAVREMARGLGGDVTLTDREGGGTLCVITISKSAMGSGRKAA